MLDTENDPLVPIDPPDNTGGGNEPELDPDTVSADARAIDPPDNTGGGK
jgi:hypothetical protein